MTVELPRWALADWLTLGLALAAGPVAEAVLVRQPGAPIGLGIGVSCLLVLWHWRQRRRRPLALALDPGSAGGHLQFGDGRSVPFRLGRGTRVLGTGVVLHWVAPGHCASLWLTPGDLPRERLRPLAASLLVAGAPPGR